MKTLMLSTASFAAIVTVGAATLGTPSVGSAVASAEQRALRFMPNGHAEMWEVYDGTGKPEHMYIRVPGGCTGRDGKPVKDPKTGKVIETWGFYFRSASNHGYEPMKGRIEAPDLMEGEGTQIIEQGNDSQFDQILANEITISLNHVPTYTWGDKLHARYVCYDWASDMWSRAFSAVYGSA